MKTTDSILDGIIADKREVLGRRQRERSLADIEADLEGRDSRPDFFEALKTGGQRPGIIAEVKRASPSAGVLREPFPLPEINRSYQSAKSVVAISVLTEEAHFRGSDADLDFFAQNNPNGKPLLRKDFIFDRYQVAESAALGASAYLLIATLFDEKELGELVAAGADYGVEPLVEIHDERELEMALSTDARCIGANARDLRDFSLDRSVHGLLRQLDGSYARVAESAVDTPEYLGKLAAYADAALIGTHFMRAPDIPAAIEALTPNEPN